MGNKFYRILILKDKTRLKRDQTELIAIMILKSIFFIDIYFKWHRHSYPFETLAFTCCNTL
jgi:hypothetical protein